MIGGNQTADEIDFDILDSITYDKIKRYLKPVIAKTDFFNFEFATSLIKDYLSSLLTPTSNELLFIKEFRNKNSRLDLLFDDANLIKKLDKHPMLLCRLKEN
jgi:hypothetical protein